MSGQVGLFIKRARMASTHSFVAVARVTIDTTNRLFLYVTDPARKRWNRLVGDAPWFGVMCGAIAIQYGPTAFVPAIGPFVTPDTRRVLEQERVRQEIQAGNDPYPYLEDREKMYGAIYHNKETRQEMMPRGSVPENQSIDAFRMRRKLQFERDIDGLDNKIAELERTANGGSTEGRFTEWLRSGFKESHAPMA
jgi:hypothetical protein